MITSSWNEYWHFGDDIICAINSQQLYIVGIIIWYDSATSDYFVGLKLKRQLHELKADII